MNIWQRRLFVILSGAIGASAILMAGALVYASLNEDRVLPGVTLGDISIGGVNRRELREYLQTMNDKLMNDGVTVRYLVNGETREFSFSPAVVGSDDVRRLYDIDESKETGLLVGRGKQGNLFKRVWVAMLSLSNNDTVFLRTLTVNTDGLRDVLKERLSKFEHPAVDARVRVSSRDPFVASIEPESYGRRFDYDKAVFDIAAAWRSLRAPYIDMAETVESPKVASADLIPLMNEIPRVLSLGSIKLVFEDADSGENWQWQISDKQIGNWLAAKWSDGRLVFGLDDGNLRDFLENHVAPDIAVAPREARFKMDDNNRVAEFQGSRAGRSLNIGDTALAVGERMAERTALGAPTSTIAVAVSVVQPSVTTADVNSFGISDALGVGISKYAGSPTNRIKNISHAVKKLNGILIAPDEEFSALKYLQPFTTDDGYFPELVIKGDELKPEVGGGLCQLGTTLFRMAMNSGMPITERQNHSLVVQYYGDLRNGLPGTDATIYEPKPDFRFKNDTGHYMLIQTEMDRDKAELRFTLWGKSDGRKGSYTAPKLNRWIPYGETKIVETDTLAPGEKKCQHAFRGADASFSYIRELPDGTKDERIFTSYYRPLPEICLVGKAGDSENQPVDASIPSDSTIPTAVE